MKFTAQEEYGLRCILSLARTCPEEPESIAESMTVGAIASREGLSTQYAGKLFRVLAKASLVESVRGCKGGYRLTRPPDRISVGEVLTALGGKFYEPKTCERYAGDRRFCVHTNECSIRSLWGGLQFILDAVLSSTTLADLVGSERLMAQWIEDNVAAVGRSLERREHRPQGAAVFSGREIPVLRQPKEGERI